MFNLSYFLSLLQKDNYVNIKIVPSVKKSKFSSQQIFVIMFITKVSYVTYNMKTICVTRLFGLLCGITSILSISNYLNAEATIKNISSICKTKLEELPYW